jgi:Zn-dependent protease
VAANLPRRVELVKGSWKIGEFAGIGVYIHPTFLILVVWVLFVYWNIGHSWSAAVVGLVFTLGLFVCVVLHEFGHALTARHYGIRTRDITLLPIGGVSNLERIPEDPKQEFLVAVMGPVVSIMIAGVLLIILKLAGYRAITVETVSSWTAVSFFQRLMVANFVLAIFNLLPAFPMDGGRIFRSGLARYLGFARATRIAAGVGHAVALVFGVLGLFTNPFLLFIAFFVWIGATQEAAMAQLRPLLAGIPLSRITVTDFTALLDSDPLGRAVELMLHGTQQIFPVIKDGRLAGILSNKELIQGLSQSGPDTLVCDVMRRDWPVISSSDTMQTALEQLQSSDLRALPVVDQGRMIGLLTAENVAEYLMLQTAINSRNHGQAKSRARLIA